MFVIADPAYIKLVYKYCAPNPESSAMAFVPFPFILKNVSVLLVAPISPTVTKASPDVIPPRRKDIPFECVIILF